MKNTNGKNAKQNKTNRKKTKQKTKPKNDHTQN